MDVPGINVTFLTIEEVKDGDRCTGGQATPRRLNRSPSTRIVILMNRIAPEAPGRINFGTRLNLLLPFVGQILKMSMVSSPEADGPGGKYSC